VLAPVVTQIISDSFVVGFVAEVLPGDQVGEHQVVVAAFGRAQHGVKDATDEYDVTSLVTGNGMYTIKRTSSPSCSSS
jgi:hypothetical protein